MSRKTSILMRRLGLVLALATLLAGLAISFAEEPAKDAAKTPAKEPEKAKAPDKAKEPEKPKASDKAGESEAKEPEKAKASDKPKATEAKASEAKPAAPPRPEPMPPVALTPEQLAEAVEVMRAISPWWADRVEDARKEDEQRFVNMVTRAYPRLRLFMELRRHDPPLYELRIKEAQLDSRSRRLSGQLHEAQQKQASEQAEQFKGELLAVLTEQFEVAQMARQHEIDTLKARLADLEKQLDEHRPEREELIQRRYDELLAGAERADRRRRDNPPASPGNSAAHPPDRDPPPPPPPRRDPER